MASQKLTGLDAIFLAAETATNPLHMMAVLVLDPATIPGGYEFEKFQEFIAGTLPLLTPLRRRLVEVPLGLDRPIWVEETKIDIDYHIRRAAVPSPGSPSEVAALASRINEGLLDRSRPLWEMVVVEGLQDGRIALIVKLQHAMMDGIAGVKLMAQLFSTTPEVEPLAIEADPPDERIPTPLELLARALPAMATRPARTLAAAAKAAQLQLRVLLEERNRGEDRASEEDELKVPRAFFNAPTTSRRIAAYTQLPVSDLKAIGKHTDATLHEVLTTIVGGAFRDYLGARDSVPESPLVVGVPISTHERGDDQANSYSVLFTSMANDIEDSIERLRVIRMSTATAKSRHGVRGGDIIKEVADIPAPWLIGLVSAAYSMAEDLEVIDPFCNTVLSNVPGPATDLYLGGARLDGLYPFGPIVDGMALNITAISSGDNLNLGMSACLDVVPDLWDLCDAVTPAFEDLKKRAGC